ncbi:MAG: metal ABC transporter permease [bacterium]|nr:metal ABC transporter permease [bacterium]
MTNGIFDFLAFDFMVRALLAGIVLAFVAPTIGMFFVVRRYAVMADTLAHISLAGIAGGLYVGIAPVWAALLACALAALGIERLREQRVLAPDAIMTLFLFGGLALGVVLLGLRPAIGVSVASFLFGSILTVTDGSLTAIAIIGACTFLITVLLWRALFTVSLDEDVARAGGLPVRFINRTLAVLGAATIAISINVVGLLLIGALMVIPVLAAMQFRVGFRATWAIALAVAVLSVVIGLMMSFSLNLASGATIVLITVFAFLASLVLSRFAAKALRS